MRKPIRFGEIEANILGGPGIYEIRTDDGIRLKVGIGKDLRKRLLQHRASRQSCLKLKSGGHWSRPGDVEARGERRGRTRCIPVIGDILRQVTRHDSCIHQRPSCVPEYALLRGRRREGQ